MQRSSASSKERAGAKALPDCPVCWSVHIAFVVGVGVAAAPFGHVGHALVKVGQGHRVLLVDVTFHVRLQQGALVIREGHGEEGFWIAHKFVDISLACHLMKTGKRNTQPYMRGTGY